MLRCSELTQTVPELSRQEWRRVQTEGYSLGQLVTMAAAVGVRPTLRRLSAQGLATGQPAGARVSRPAFWSALQCADRHGWWSGGIGRPIARCSGLAEGTVSLRRGPRQALAMRYRLQQVLSGEFDTTLDQLCGAADMRHHSRAR